MSPITDFLINDAEVAQDMLIIIFSLPFIASIIGIARYYVGIKTINLYSPILLCTAYFLISVKYTDNSVDRITSGVSWGLLFTVITIITTIIFNYSIKNLRLHFFPKVTLLYIIVILTQISTLITLEYFEMIAIKNIDFTGLIIITLVSEQFINMLIKKKLSVSVRLSVETILIALLCFLLMSLTPVQELLLNRPELVLLTLPVNYLIGRYTGLRLTEYLRFQEILDKEELPDEPN